MIMSMTTEFQDPFFKDFDEEELYDHMTGAYTKSMFSLYGEHLISQKTPFCIAFIDFDNFKKVNDNLGHQTGDKALIDMVNTIKGAVKDEGAVFRYGGDEFMVIIPNVQQYNDIWNIGRKISLAVRSKDFPYLKDAVSPLERVTVTIGMARYPFDARTLPDLIKLADKALYRGKIKGKNCFIIYLKELHAGIDVSKSHVTDEISGILNHLFVIFRQNKTAKELLKDSVVFVASYYNSTMVSVFNEKEDHLVYEAKDPEGMIYGKISPYVLHLEGAEDPIRIYYKSALNRDEYEDLIKAMEKLKISTTLLFPTTMEDGTKGYLRIDSRRDLIWSDEEILAYQELSNLYGYYNFLLLRNKEKKQDYSH